MPDRTCKPWVKEFTDTGILPLMAAGAVLMLALIVISAFVLRWLLV